MKTVTALIALALVAAVVGGCRSDGGIGRYDSVRSRAWTAHSFAAQNERDVAATQETLASIAAWPCTVFDDPFVEINRTWSLYIEGTTSPRDR